ncbi:transcriptional coactivator p15/PC4 family protein [Variovorax sp. V116]|uniref:transcriptional coactivator p15/PC4 family protein n=1 Tax=Variovorax sp. V116 TaxID=3065953 RepID=UPI0034E8AC14
MMSPERAAELTASRNSLTASIQALKDAPPQDDGTKKAKRAIKDWQFDLSGFERMVAQIDGMLAAKTPREPPAPEVVPWVQMGTTIAAIPKGRRAELRVSVNEWRGLRTVDLRLWFMPKDGGAWGPSRKGVAIDAAKVDALLEALTLAKKHLQ